MLRRSSLSGRPNALAVEPAAQFGELIGNGFPARLTSMLRIEPRRFSRGINPGQAVGLTIADFSETVVNFVPSQAREGCSLSAAFALILQGCEA